MKSRHVLRAAVSATVLFAVALACSCTSTNLASNRTGWSDYATVAIKDYTVVGIVRVTSEEITRRGFLGIAHSHKGSQVTYDLLVSEAKKIGADDIINVRIDRTDKSLHGVFDWLVGYTERYAYTANALAIRYTQAVAGSLADAAGGPGTARTGGTDHGHGTIAMADITGDMPPQSTAGNFYEEGDSK
jgi:uncharacterized protein YbjQ (UPF0145 family)